VSLVQFSRALGRDDKLISIDAATPLGVSLVWRPSKTWPAGWNGRKTRTKAGSVGGRTRWQIRTA